MLIAVTINELTCCYNNNITIMLWLHVPIFIKTTIILYRRTMEVVKEIINIITKKCIRCCFCNLHYVKSNEWKAKLK